MSGQAVPPMLRDGIPQCEPSLPVQNCCGLVPHRHRQLCCARSAATHLQTVWAPMTPSRHRAHSSQWPGPCGEGVPLTAGSLVSESLLEQMSAVLRALPVVFMLWQNLQDLALLWRTWGRAGDSGQGCRSSTGGLWAMFSHQL